MYKSFLRPILFQFDPEKVHHFTFKLIGLIHKIPGVAAINRSLFNLEDDRLKVRLFGLEFKNPVGLAAGFDKDGKLFSQLSNYGFGFIEVGTVTPKPQAGNDKPRLFRLRDDQALINRMGFNNAGVEDLTQRLKNRPKGLIVGGNIGKNKVTPNEDALSDYMKCFEALFEYVDYFVVNVSSPNTPNLRALQEKEPLTKLLKALQQRNVSYANPKPILLKIAPDLTDSQLDDIIDIVRDAAIAGVIATNTTIDRSDLKASSQRLEEIGAGGLSGKPVRQRSTDVVKYLHSKSEGQIPIVAVGGIFTAEDAREKLEAGASLVQVYTGFIYEGPGMVKRICRGLLQSGI